MPTEISMRLKTAVLLGVLIVAVACCSSASAYVLEGGRWPTTTITYYNEVPAYSWSVDTAAYAWNTSGARVQFVRGSKRDADVLIGIRWFKLAGDANVQRIADRFVAARVGVRSGQDRYALALVLAHELGHVLGLDHEDDVCATMNSVLMNNAPSHCAQPPAGTWVCRLLRTDDVRGAVALYGGTVKAIRGPEFCSR